MRRYIPLPLPLSLPCKQDKSSSFLVLRSPQVYPSSFCLAQHLPLDERKMDAHERTQQHSVCGNAATEPRRPSVRPSGSVSLPLDERQNVHERTQHSVEGNDGAESSRFCQGAFLFRWMNEKGMVRNERSILCAETTVRNHVVCVSGSVRTGRR